MFLSAADWEPLPIGAPLLRVTLRCPNCRHQGTFEPLVAQDVALHAKEGATTHTVIAGQRRCPNPDCHGHIFFASDGRKLLLSYPAERIDFDTTNVPQPVCDSLNEAITCHAERCYVASAIMVRKTLEELCRDRNATGDNLKERISDLRNKVVLPQELLDGLDDIRLLGNDAAHIESQVYNQVGQDEVEVAIAFTKEVLKSVYQYAALLERLRKLKKSP